MSKELQAFYKIKDKLIKVKGNITCGSITDLTNLDIIESALKENERLKSSYLENLLNEESKEYIYKKLKALEIIKEKHVDIDVLLKSPSLTLYNTILTARNENKYKLTQEEYDLLKEVLL